jgi:thymidylate kinase
MTARKSRLIALDGGAGVPLDVVARNLAHSLRDATGAGGVSSWDASGIFTDLSADDSEVATASARTLTLLYAADLAFRVRWHIVPALEAGESVVAAPYVESAKALAIAAGLPKRWLDELFAFAPKPSICYRVDPAALRGTSRGRSSYPEWFTGIVASNGHGISPKQLQAKSTEYLKAAEARRRCKLLTPAEMDRLTRPMRRRR